MIFTPVKITCKHNTSTHMSMLIFEITESDRDHDLSGLSDWAYDNASGSYQTQIRLRVDVTGAHLDENWYCLLRDVDAMASVPTVGKYSRDDVEGITLAENSATFRLVRTPKNDIAIQIANTNKATVIGSIKTDGYVVFYIHEYGNEIALSKHGGIIYDILLQKEDESASNNKRNRQADTEECACLCTKNIEDVIAKRIRTAYANGEVIDVS